MIIIGKATVNAQGIVQLDSQDVAGFNTLLGVRLSNAGTDACYLQNISGRDQSVEVLMPQTQMVYQSVNVGMPPTLIPFSLSPEQFIVSLTVEWSTDPETDFIGTYPAALPVPLASETNIVDGGSSTVYQLGKLGPAYDVHNYQSLLVNWYTRYDGDANLKAVWTDADHNYLSQQSVWGGGYSGSGSFNNLYHSVRLNVQGYYVNFFTDIGNVGSNPIQFYITGSQSPIVNSDIAPGQSGQIGPVNEGSVIGPYTEGLYTNAGPALNATGLRWPTGGLAGPAALGGSYQLDVRAPDDAAWELAYYFGAPYNPSLGTAAVFQWGSTNFVPLCISTEGYTVNGLRYINKRIELPVMRQTNGNYPVFNVFTASSGGYASMATSISLRPIGRAAF